MSTQDIDQAQALKSNPLPPSHSHRSFSHTVTQIDGSNRPSVTGSDRSAHHAPATGEASHMSHTPVSQDVVSLAASLFFVMSSLATVHSSPHLLRRAHEQLCVLADAVGAARKQEGAL